MDSPQAQRDEWMDHHSGPDEWMDIIVAVTNGWDIIVARPQVDRKHFFIGFPFP
jgi:hypothetical protein